jgi:glycosyltransferase involved in cell wall biosynthesis
MADADQTGWRGHRSTPPHWPGRRGPVVLQVISSLEPGGSATSAADLSTGIIRAGGKSIIVSTGGALVSRIRRAGATHIDMAVGTNNVLTMYSNSRAIAKLIRKHKVDLVHQEGFIGAWSAFNAAAQTSTPIIGTVYRLTHPTGRFHDWSTTSLLGAKHLIAVSDFVASKLNDGMISAETELTTISRGVDVTQFNPGAINADRLIQLANHWSLPDGVPIVMVPARIAGGKGQTMVVDALAQIGRRDVMCLIAGKINEQDPYYNELVDLILAKDIADIVKIVGECHDMPAAYMLADVVVSASTEPEAFGRVCVEAQAMGRPVIATDHGGAQEAVLQGRTGWLVPPGNSRALAGALAAAIDLDASTRADVALVARRHAIEAYSLDLMCEKTFELYDGILASGATPEAPPEPPETSEQIAASEPAEGDESET